jgi:hypothetical protein
MGRVNYFANVPNTDDDDTGSLRLDHRLGQALQLAGRWTEYRGANFVGGPTPLTGGNQGDPRQRALLLSATHVLSPRWLHELRLGYTRNRQEREVQDVGLNAATIFTDAAGRPLPGVVEAARDFGTAWLIEANYQGSAGRRLGMFIDVNQPAVLVRDPARRGPVAPNEQVFPYPQFGNIQLAQSIGSSQHNGWSVTGKYQHRGGLYLSGHYTLGKTLDDNSSYFGSGNLPGEAGAPVDARHLRLEQSACSSCGNDWPQTALVL